MVFRCSPAVAIAFVVGLGLAPATAEEGGTSAANTAGYRAYVKTQADTLLGMTRVLAREIKDGNLEAAQAAYAPAHRYLARIEPLVRILRFDARMDANPAATGFHAIEYGLFAKRSTTGLVEAADRLVKDARELRERAALADPAPDVLFGEAARLTQEIASRKLSGDEERYARSDLWDFEANVEGVHEIVALMQAQPGAPVPAARTDVHFAKIADLLAKHKDGCGFKTFDEVSVADKAALKAAVTALLQALAASRSTASID